MQTRRLIIANIAVYVALKAAWIALPEVPADFEALLSWLAMPGDAARLLSRPWTLLTYSFVQVDFLHLLVNMLWLGWFGAVLGQLHRDRSVLRLYLAGALAGAAAYLLHQSIAAGGAGELTGASAATAAIVTAATVYAPRYPVRLILVGNVPLWALAPVVALSFLSGPSDALFAHAGGIAAGAVAAWMWSRKARVSILKQRNSNNLAERRSRLLAKARTSGYASLSDTERRQLFDLSRRQ